MRLFLLRHGPAVDRDAWDGAEADRPLTEAGRLRTVAMVEACRDLVRAEVVLTSPWLRAEQTARIAGRAWGLPVRVVPWLVPEASTPGGILGRLTGSVVLVGHEPGLGDLIGAACGGAAVPLKKAGLAVLEGEPSLGGMALRLLLTPKAVEALR